MISVSRRYIAPLAGCLLAMNSFAAAAEVSNRPQDTAPSDNARLIVTTDLGGSDPDDIQSMIHLLVCSDRVDLEGLISTEAWVDDPDKTDKLRQTVEHFIESLPTLRKMRFPAKRLRCRPSALLIQTAMNCHTNGRCSARFRPSRAQPTLKTPTSATVS